MADAGEAMRQLQASLLAGEDIEAPDSAEVEVQGLGYVLPGGGKRAPPREILSGVSCAFPPGKLSAIMGASGSGKTSLLTLMRGLTAPGARTSGRVLCNGQVARVDRMRSLASVVPQEDVFLAALTPREMLSFAAELRLPSSWSPEDRARRVDLVLQLLRLESCASTPIGGGMQGLHGISGGERRRLSIGLSIVGGLPQLLLCDEPTSGLDSAAAASTMGILEDLASRGVTVICAIHQPSYDIFRQFSTLLLLEAGRVVFFGGLAEDDPKAVEAYFARFGAPTPVHTNPAHHYITEIQAHGDLWAQRWAAAQEGDAATAPPATRRRQRPVRGAGGGRPTAWEQTVILTRRTILENFKNRRKFFRGIMSRLPTSIVIGTFFWRIATGPLTQPSVFTLRGVLFITVQSPIIDSFYAGAASFQSTRGMLKREYYDGLYQISPYYLAYHAGFLAMQMPWTFAWVVPLYLLVGLPLEFEKVGVFVLTIFLVIVLACAAGSTVGTWTKDTEGNRAVLMPAFIPMVIFSGYVIPYAQIPWVWKPIYFVSPLQWAITIIETSRYRGLEFDDCDASLPREDRRCFATGEEFLEEHTTQLAQALGIPGMLCLCFGYIVFFMLCNIRAIRKCVLDGRV